MRKAFTLIELLIVIAIISILAVAFLPALIKGPAKARDAARTAFMRDMVNVFEKELTEGTPNIPKLGPEGDPGDHPQYCLDFSVGLGATYVPYLKKIPKSYASSLSKRTLCFGYEGESQEYFYKSLASNGNYMVAVQMELPGSANVEEGVAASRLRQAGDDGDNLLALTDGPVGNGESGNYYYIIVK